MIWIEPKIALKCPGTDPLSAVLPLLMSMKILNEMVGCLTTAKPGSPPYKR